MPDEDVSDQEITTTVVHVVDDEGTDHWGSPFGVLGGRLERGEVREAEDAPELPAQRDGDDAGDSEDRSGDPVGVAGDADDSDDEGVPDGSPVD